ncbi:IIH subunit 5 General transcription factor [Takifugu flavidus]|uniref:General transcription and DNA repair factor IIH subunit TFB5 n=1 Tax=Takifugu flavidus TaxID=433684 RepID=A0A5C6MIL8_9TELE|nr:IIH subunit 5 General transcription factor [Takifugu flavidus]
MVNVHKGVLLEWRVQLDPDSIHYDPAMKEFLLHLDETMALGRKFILKDLDETHLFILAEVVQTLQERVGELMDQNSFPITQK